MKRHLGDRRRLSPRTLCISCAISFLVGTICSLATLQITGGFSPQWYISSLHVPLPSVPDTMTDHLRLLYYYNSSYVFTTPSPTVLLDHSPLDSQQHPNPQSRSVDTPLNDTVVEEEEEEKIKKKKKKIMEAVDDGGREEMINDADYNMLYDNNVEEELQLEERTKFVNAWYGPTAKSCAMWTVKQREMGAYVDAYVIGSQKGATSQLSKQLHMLGVRKDDMAKEWHFFNQLTSEGTIIHGRTMGQSLPPLDNLDYLRRMHYSMGFPTSSINNTSSPLPLIEPLTKRQVDWKAEALQSEEIQTDVAVDTTKTRRDDAKIEKDGRTFEQVDNRRRIVVEREKYEDFENRSLVIDMTVEYLHSERSAFLVNQLTPYARIIITIRDPLARALSHYNMAVRNTNAKLRVSKSATLPATPQSFDQKVRAEISKLSRCGYDFKTATLDRPTSSLTACMFSNSYREHFDDLLYITRGLYFLHIQAWRSLFPDHHFLILSFRDLALGNPHVFHDLTDFLCIKKFPAQLLSQFQNDGSTLSFGQQAASRGLEEAGSDSYTGDDRYLSDMMPETRQFLNEFFAPANEKLKRLVGSHFVYWTENENETQT